MPDDPLKNAFDALDDPPVENLGPAIRARVAAHQRRRRVPAVWRIAAALVVAGVGVSIAYLATRGPGDKIGAGRWRGDEAAGEVLDLGFVIEGEGALDAETVRPVGPSERIIFTVQTDRDAFLCLDEQGDGAWKRIYPGAEEGWRVSAGNHWPGGDVPLSFGTEHGPGTRVYRVLADPEHADCSAPTAEEQVEVRWQ